MKSVLVVVSIIAVFSAASREFPDKSDLGPAYLDEPFPEESVGTNIAEEPKNTHDRTDIRGLADEVQNFPGEPVEHESADGIQVSNDGPQGLYQQFIEESEGINTAQLRGKKQDKILKKILKDLEYIKEEVQKEVSSINQNMDNKTSLIISKLDSINTGNSELKKEVSSMEHNMDNKTSLIISKLVSINTGNSELKKKVSSMEQNMDNKTSLVISKLDSINTGNSELKKEVSSMEQNMDNKTSLIISKLDSINTGNSELKKEVSSMEHNMDNKTSLVISKLDSINTGNSELKKKVSSMEQNMDNKTSLIISKLDSIIPVIEPLTSLDPIHPPTTTPAGCPLGFILIDDQCYKYITDQYMNWMDADEMCRSQGLTLAQPRDPLGIRKYLVENYGDYYHTWLGARGTGSVIQWQRGGQVLSSTSAYWWPGQPGGTSSDYCLLLLTSSHYLNIQPNKPYYSQGCTHSRYPLCEKM